MATSCRSGVRQFIRGRGSHVIWVAAGYRISGRREVSIDLAGYDRTRPLVVDPIIDLVNLSWRIRPGDGIARVTVDT
jgi:hypothetical protein